MGREIRRVPPNWQHPQKEEYNPRKRCYETVYVALHDDDVESAFAEWLEEYTAWVGGEHAQKSKERGPELYPLHKPYECFCDEYGTPPIPDQYRPKWDATTATWYQVYETVSDGTPVTPPFETQSGLIDYLVANGDFWDQSRRAECRSGFPSMPCDPWPREQAERFVLGGVSTPTFVMNTGTGKLDPGHLSTTSPNS